jgi:hypothetical protein
MHWKWESVQLVEKGKDNSLAKERRKRSHQELEAKINYKLHFSNFHMPHGQIVMRD